MAFHIQGCLAVTAERSGRASVSACVRESLQGYRVAMTPWGRRIRQQARTGRSTARKLLHRGVRTDGDGSDPEYELEHSEAAKRGRAEGSSHGTNSNGAMGLMNILLLNAIGDGGMLGQIPPSQRTVDPGPRASSRDSVNAEGGHRRSPQRHTSVTTSEVLEKFEPNSPGPLVGLDPGAVLHLSGQSNVILRHFLILLDAIKVIDGETANVQAELDRIARAYQNDVRSMENELQAIWTLVAFRKVFRSLANALVLIVVWQMLCEMLGIPGSLTSTVAFVTLGVFMIILTLLSGKAIGVLWNALNNRDRTHPKAGAHEDEH